MKKTYLKPTSLTVKVAPQQLICLSKTDDPALKTGKVYGRESRFSEYDEEEE